MKAVDNKVSPMIVDICERKVSLVYSHLSLSITKLFNKAIERSTLAWTFSKSVLIAWACEMSCAYSSLYAAMKSSNSLMSFVTSWPWLMLVSAWRSNEFNSSRKGSTRFNMSAYSTWRTRFDSKLIESRGDEKTHLCNCPLNHRTTSHWRTINLLEVVIRIAQITILHLLTNVIARFLWKEFCIRICLLKVLLGQAIKFHIISVQSFSHKKH